MSTLAQYIDYQHKAATHNFHVYKAWHRSIPMVLGDKDHGDYIKRTWVQYQMKLNKKSLTVAESFLSVVPIS